MDTDKKEFLQKRFVPLLMQIPSDTPPKWGKMSLQQMIEHFTDSVRIASGRITTTDVVTPPERLQKMRDFIMSEKPFRENTLNPTIPETPAPVKLPSANDAAQELQEELDLFFAVFEENNLAVTRNPVFGDLNYEENLQLLYKHAMHHLRQFGIVPDEEQN